MGSRFLKKDEAAKILGCHKDTISKHIQRGALRPVVQGRYVGVLEEDVLALRDSKRKSHESRVLPFAINRLTLHRFHEEIRVLRQDVDRLLRVLNIRREKLQVSDIEARALFLTAQEYAIEGWPPHVEELWVDHFLRIDVDFLKQVGHITQQEHPWIPFLKLASTMTVQPYNTELTIQLIAGRDNLRSLVAVWFEIFQISPRELDAMISREASPSQRLVGVLSRRQKKLDTDV